MIENKKMTMALFTCFVSLFYFVMSLVKANLKYAELCDTTPIKLILFEQHRAVTVFERDFRVASYSIL